MDRRRALMAAQGAVEDLHLNDILTLDGIKNTRSGHNSSSTKWEDLSGNQHDFTLISGASAPIWRDNRVSFDATNRVLQNTDGLFGTDKSISVELIAQVIDYGTMIDGSTKLGYLVSSRPYASDNGIAIYSYNTGGASSYWANTSLGYTGDLGPTKSHRYICWVFNNNSCNRYVDGVLAGTSSPSTFFGNTSRIASITVGGNVSYYCYADIYRFGIDGTAFSADDVANRYQYFKQRFNMP